MDGANQLIARSFDPARAIFYGQFIEAVYSMYASAPSIPTPSPPSTFPADHKFVAWIQMKDFVVEEGNWTFYGLIARSTSKPNEHVLAIRGTENLTEWWDDLTSMVAVPVADFGAVAYGFQRIYQTLRVVDYSPPGPLGAKVPARSLETAGTFADQVAAAIQTHAATGERPSEATAPSAATLIEVTGHSLGAALATLYVAENAVGRKVATPVICTFASPRVGDSVFKTKFDQLGITSWRIVNELDVVPKLPFLGFWHVNTEEAYNSGPSVDWSLACWHSLNTYLHLLDPKQPLSSECQRAQRPSANATLRPNLRPAQATTAPLGQVEKEIALSVPPDHGPTISITIKIGRTD